MTQPKNDKPSNGKAFPGDRQTEHTLATSPVPVKSAPDWADQVVLDLDLPHLDVAHALARSDDAAIWRQCRESGDQAAFLDSVTTLAGSYVTQQPNPRVRPSRIFWNHQLIAAAFLLPPHGWAAPVASEPDRRAAGGIRNELQRCVGYTQQLTILLADIRYADVCRWSPSKQREHLLALAREQPDVGLPLLPEQLRIPEGFPELAFVVASVQRCNCLPDLPEPGAGLAREWEFRSRLAGHLAYSHHRPIQPEHVLLPAKFSQAVLDGLRLWLAEIARRGLVCAWDLHLRRDDLVILELTATDCDKPAAFIPIRSHQIGSGGLGLLTADLQERLGPQSDGPLA